MPMGQYVRKVFVRRQVVHVIGPSIAYLPTTKGLFALIDSEDAERVGKFNWICVGKENHSKYAQRWDRCSPGSGPSGRICHHIQLHREILGMGSDDLRMLDHKNRNGLDNRKANLRIATHAQNMFNIVPKPRPNGLPRGVSASGNRYSVTVAHKHMGMRDTVEEAAELFAQLTREKYGEDYA